MVYRVRRLSSDRAAVPTRKQKGPNANACLALGTLGLRRRQPIVHPCVWRQRQTLGAGVRAAAWFTIGDMD